MIMIRSKPGAECVETLLAGLPEQTLTCCCKKKDFVFERRCGFFLQNLSVTKTLITRPASCRKIMDALAAAGSILEEQLLT